MHKKEAETSISTLKKKECQELITQEALNLGYDLVGFSPLNLEPQDSAHLSEFAKEHSSSDMKWFGRRLGFRLHPEKLHPQAKGAVVLGCYYRDWNGEAALKKGKVFIARYAHGKDYHRVLRKKAKKLLHVLQKSMPYLVSRVCVDSAPIPEKILGRMAGLGWQGKNTNLIHPQLGSYFFLSVILVNIDFPSAETVSDHCKNCRLCVDACPTGALRSETPYRLDAKKCLSYLTIEKKDQPSPEFQNAFSGWAFGCDICQEVCPYNRNRQARERTTSENGFLLDRRISSLIKTGKLPAAADWEEWSIGTALRRVSMEKMQTNLSIAQVGSTVRCGTS